MMILKQKFEHIHVYHTMTEFPDASKFERHCHNSFELIYVLRGKGKYVVEGVEYPLAPNTILLLRPNEYHYVCPQESTPYERYVIHFDEEILFGATKTLSIIQATETGTAGIYFPHDSIDPMIRSQFEITNIDFSADDKQASARPSRAETLFRTMTNQALILLSYCKPNVPTAGENEWMSAVMRYLNEHLSDSISLEEIAHRFFVSKYHLCHSFKEHMGVSLFSYLTTKRIALAEQLLEDGLPATEVAERVGFGDYSVFYRAYRKQTGKSPSKTKVKT